MNISPKASLALATLALAGLAAAAPVKADPLVIGGGWQQFIFQGPGSLAVPEFTYTSAGPVLLKVTDAFEAGDSFDVNIDGSLAFSTPSVAPDSSSADNQPDPDLAYASPIFSHASYLAPAGSHTIDIFTRESPFGSGGAFIRADAPVPEASSSVGLGLLLALGGAVIVARRKKAQA